MYGCLSRLFCRRPVAPALVGVLAFGGLSLLPAADDQAKARAVAGGHDILSGSARVIDGDTLEIAGRRVRLEGIDAPETGQMCARSDGSGNWKCGEAAAERLASLIYRRPVSCEDRGEDKYRRMLGVCFVSDVDINALLVREGLAWAFVKYSDTYVREEAEARARRVGLWQAETVPAWEYREQRWAHAEQAAPEGCAIKGNISGRGRIYHMPWGPWYGKVKIEEVKGERWFCSEAEAAAAGWRPVVAQ